MSQLTASSSTSVPPPWAARLCTGLLLLACVIGGRAQQPPAAASPPLLTPALAPEGIDVTQLEVQRSEGGLILDFAAKVYPNRTVEDALQRGIAIYFTAEATVLRPRWYWRDERVAQASRTWRISYQPLTATWRVGSGGLSQTVASQADALALASRFSGWKIAEASRVAPDERYVVEFSYKLDTSQLPRPMQLNVGALNEWSLEFERKLRME